jgi:hypothetical protein
MRKLIIILIAFFAVVTFIQTVKSETTRSQSRAFASERSALPQVTADYHETN